jgi:putative transposase
VILTYRYRLLPLKSQHRALERLCASQRELYNAALEERIDCYRKTGKTRTYIDQCKALTECRHELPDMGELPANLQRWTLKRLDDAFQGFFRRLKARNGKAGFPRFRGKGRWEAFGFAEFSGIRFDGKRLRFAGMPGGLKVHLHRELPEHANVRSCVFRRDGSGWFVCL